jgi:hypothetical protein
MLDAKRDRGNRKRCAVFLCSLSPCWIPPSHVGGQISQCASTRTSRMYPRRNPNPNILEVCSHNKASCLLCPASVGSCLIKVDCVAAQGGGRKPTVSCHPGMAFQRIACAGWHTATCYAGRPARLASRPEALSFGVGPHCGLGF